MPDMPQGPQTMTPEQQLSLMQMLQMARGNTMGNQPQTMPMLPGGEPTQPRLGGNNIMLPSGTASAGVPKIPMAAAPPQSGGGGSQTGPLFRGIPGLVMQVKQKMHQDKANKAQALTNQYIALKQSSDPQLQKTAEMLLSDPKNHKIFDKAVSDPNSAEYQGVQRAYQEQEARAQYQQSQQKEQLTMQHLISQIMSQRASAAKDTALTPQNEEERAIAMGTKPSAEVQEQIKARQQAAKDNLDYKREALQENIDLKMKQMADKRTTDQERMQLQREIAQGRLEMTRMMMEWRVSQASEKSKIPATLIGRFVQADIIKEQIDDLESKLDDPELKKYMGPIAGRTTGAAARVFGNTKVQEFYASQESLDALLAILHAYRGGAQIHGVFKQSMGTLAMDPESYRGTLRAIRKLTDNVTNEGKAMFPNDPLWKMNIKQEAVPVTRTPLGSGTESDPIIVP